MNDFLVDDRHKHLERMAKETLQRVDSLQAPELIYDWLNGQLAKMRPDERPGAVMQWPESFDMYDAEILRRLEMAKLPEGERKIYDWRWPSWNQLIDPLEPGMLAVVAAPTGSGKTSYAENIAEHWARRGLKVVFVHFELSKIVMLDRRAVRHTAIARRVLKLADTLTQAQLAEIETVKRTMLAWPGQITYLHTPGWSMELVLRSLAGLQAAGQCDVAVIDYLEKAAPSPAQLKAYGANGYQREANDVELVKIFSELHGVPMLMLSQLNKAGSDKSLADMELSDIRGAGEKSEKANIVILLKPDKDGGGVMDLKLAKNTMGPHGQWQQFFDAPRFQITDVYRKQLQ